jgi:hypothetical protein
MRRKSRRQNTNLVVIGLLLAAWLTAYMALPRLSPYDGPFNAEPFGFDSTTLPFMSKAELKIFGAKLFILESRENQGPAPGTVFVLRNRSGRILWTRLGAPELGRIRLTEKSARWFIPGGWIVKLKPEYTGAGDMYISPFGQFRFFFHRW